VGVALPLENVVETMRPLPIDSIAGTPPHVLGLAVVRGAAVPVIDPAPLIGGEAGPAARFVLLRVSGRRLAVAVSEVVGVRRLSPDGFAALPPLFTGTGAEAVAGAGIEDEALLVVLRCGRLVPEPAWTELEGAIPAS